MASLYHSGSRCKGTALRVMVNPQDMRRHRLGIEPHIVGTVMPRVGNSGEEIFNKKLIRQAEIRFRNLEPPFLRTMRIQIDDDEKKIRTVRGDLAVSKDFGIIDCVKAQAFISVERRILPPNAVY